MVTVTWINVNTSLTMFKQKLNEFAKKTGRQLRLEIESGTYMIAHAGILITTIDDIVDTGSEGYTFLRLSTGINDFLPFLRKQFLQVKNFF